MSLLKPALVFTKTEILSKSWDIVLEHGAELSLAEFAAACQVPLTNFKAYFPTRTHLLKAILLDQDLKFNIFDKFIATLEQPDARKRLDLILNIWFEFIPKIYPILSELIRLRLFDTDAGAALQFRMQAQRDMYHRVVTKIFNQGDLNPNFDVAQATDFLWVNTSIQIWAAYRFDRHWPHDQICYSMHQTIFTGLSPHLPPPARPNPALIG